MFATIFDMFATIFDVFATIFATFDVFATIFDMFAILFNVFAAIFNLFAVIFNVFAAIFDVFATIFDVFATIFDAFATIVDVFATIFDMFAILFNVFAAIFNLFAVIFNVFAAIFDVFATIFDVFATIFDAFATIVDEFATIFDMFAILFNVFAAIFNLFAVIFNVFAAIFDVFATIYDVFATIFDVFATIVDVFATIFDMFAILFNVFAAIFNLFAVIFNVFATIFNVFAILFNVFAAILNGDFGLRLAELRAAVAGGSMTPEALKMLEPHMESGAVQMLENEEVVSAVWADQHQCWQLDLLNSYGGELPMETDFIWLATGSVVDAAKDPVFQGLLREYPTQLLGGLPTLTKSLRWADDVDVFVLGAYAALQLGPGAGNLMGAKTAAVALVDELHREAQLDTYANIPESVAWGVALGKVGMGGKAAGVASRSLCAWPTRGRQGRGRQQVVGDACQQCNDEDAATNVSEGGNWLQKLRQALHARSECGWGKSVPLR
eukprot:gene1831-33249_t